MAEKPRSEDIGRLMLHLFARDNAIMARRRGTAPTTAKGTANELRALAVDYLNVARQYDELPQPRLPGFTPTQVAALRLEDRRNEGRRIDNLTRRLEGAIESGDCHSAAQLGFMLGRVSGMGFWRVFLEADADLGRKVIGGGRAGAEAHTATRQKSRAENVAKWLRYGRTLPSSLSHAGASKRIAQHFGVSWETVRRVLPKKPW